jgi:hypothetical protein
VDDVKHATVICQLHARDHDDTAKPCVPIVVADETAFGSGALAIGDVRHSEADVRRRVERFGIEDSDTVPA